MEKSIKCLKEEISKLRGYAVIIDGEDGEWEPVTTVSVEDIYGLINQLDKLEVLSQEWISKHSNGPSRSQYVWVDDLKEILVPKQEEVDRAYKDGYEKGKQHTFYKGYLEGLADKEKESETVADVVSTFWKSFERLKEVMNMEVEELEE